MTQKRLRKNGRNTAAKKMAGKVRLPKYGGKNALCALLLMIQLTAGSPGRPKSKKREMLL